MSKFKTIAVVSYPAEAGVIKSKLESENIIVILKDEFTVATDLFATNALGGVKLQVYKEDYVKAIGLVEQYAPELMQANPTQMKCPNCGLFKLQDQQDIHTATTFSQRLRAIRLSLFPSTSTYYRCGNCDHEFEKEA